MSNISCDILPGEFLFLTGVSGAGKSTFLRLIMGLERSDSGHVIYNGTNVNQLEKKKFPNHLRSIGMIFQDYKLLENKTALENIKIPLQIRGISAAKGEKQISRMVDQIGIGHLLKQSIKSLSGGEQQLISVARAAIHDPLVILADEPTANLDQKMAAKILRILKQLNNNGITVIIATHNIHLIKSHNHRTILIKNAGLVEVR